MIRFSAALVAVAIGVLIGGIATSKLLLVYIAIVVSAVALVALAIGVVLKREELFGEGQGLVPAGAGAAPVPSARAGESQDQPRPASIRAAVGPVPGADGGLRCRLSAALAFDGSRRRRHRPDGTAARSGVAAGSANPSARRARPRSGQRPADRAGRTRCRRGKPSRPATSGHPRPGRGSTAAGPAPDWMPGGRGASDRRPGRVDRAVPARRPDVRPAEPRRAGPAAGADRRPRVAELVRRPKARPADAAAARHAKRHASPGRSRRDAGRRGRRLADPLLLARRRGGREPRDEADAAATPPTAAEAVPAPARRRPDVGAAGQRAGRPRVRTPVAYGRRAPSAADGQRPASGRSGRRADTARAGRRGRPTGEPPSAGQAGPDARRSAMVAVLPGVPRYHQPDCVLIRFMPEDDIQRMPIRRRPRPTAAPPAPPASPRDNSKSARPPTASQKRRPSPASA